MLAGRPRRLCLTLGALAELEDAYRAEDLSALVARFAGGKLAARDLMRLIGAGLAGGGEPMDAAELAALGRDDSLAEMAAAAGELLRVTFGGEATASGPDSGPNSGAAGGPPETPFPGTR